MYKIHAVHKVQLTEDMLILIIDSKEYKFRLSDISKKLAKATKEEKSEFIVSPSGYGIHWPKIDEDISIHSLIMNK